MSNTTLCTENEATLISGVSSRTLLRFSEAGYLTLHLMPDGSRRYEQAQVEEIFGGTGAPTPNTSGHESNNQSRQAISQRCEGHDESAKHERQEQLIPQERSKPTGLENPEHTLGPSDAASPLTSRDSRDVEEIARLRNLLSLQERILDSKDDEIADLRSQRAWLRERIEKLEEKSDRDQILLLSETQTIRSLLAYQESRKSTFRQLLEWAGLYRPPSSGVLPAAGDYHSKPASPGSSSRTIEVLKAANSD